MFTDTIKETGTYTIRFWIKALAAVTATLECYSFSKDISVTQEWQEVCETFTVAELSDVMLNLPAGEYYIYDNKLEAGTKATPYTVAPEDVDNSILKLNTKYTSLSQTVDGFTATISSLQSSMLEKADSSSVTTLQSNLATLSASVDSFKTTVADTYTTKQSFADGTKDFVTTSALNSAIDQKSNSILLSVSGTYTKKADYDNYVSSTDATLALKVNKDTLVSEINASADVITLTANRFSLDSTYSKIHLDGCAEFTKGLIGGFTIDSDDLYSELKVNGNVRYGAGIACARDGTAGSGDKDGIAFWAGTSFAQKTSAAFRVTYGGQLKTNNINAWGGNIGNWVISGDAVNPGCLLAGDRAGAYTYLNTNAIFLSNGESDGASSITGGTINTYTLNASYAYIPHIQGGLILDGGTILAYYDVGEGKQAVELDGEDILKLKQLIS